MSECHHYFEYFNTLESKCKHCGKVLPNGVEDWLKTRPWTK